MVAKVCLMSCMPAACLLRKALRPRAHAAAPTTTTPLGAAVADCLPAPPLLPLLTRAGKQHGVCAGGVNPLSTLRRQIGQQQHAIRGSQLEEPQLASSSRADQAACCVAHVPTYLHPKGVCVYGVCPLPPGLGGVDSLAVQPWPLCASKQQRALCQAGRQCAESAPTHKGR